MYNSYHIFCVDKNCPFINIFVTVRDLAQTLFQSQTIIVLRKPSHKALCVLNMDQFIKLENVGLIE